MNDYTNGIVEGLSVALFLAEENRKHPNRIETRLLQTLQDVAKSVGQHGLDKYRIEADLVSKLGTRGRADAR